MNENRVAPHPPDHFLIGIVAGAIVLVVAALAVVIMRAPPVYLPDTSPENVASNYLLALQQRDYAHVQGYLSPKLKGYPASAAEVADLLTRNNYGYGDLASASRATFTIRGAEPLKDSAGTIRVRVQAREFNGGRLFGGGEYRSESYIDVAPVDGALKINGGDRWFSYCWTYAGGCR